MIVCRVLAIEYQCVRLTCVERTLGFIMTINRQTDEEGEIQIGITDQGLVRIYVRSKNVDLPMDFTPDEAEEIAAEIQAAAESAKSRPD